MERSEGTRDEPSTEGFQFRTHQQHSPARKDEETHFPHVRKWLPPVGDSAEAHPVTLPFPLRDAAADSFILSAAPA